MVSFSEFRALCEARRSIRYFDTKPISDNDVKQLLEVAQLAPNIQNTQPWHFHVVLDADLRSKLLEASCYGNFIAGAGAFIAVTCNKGVKPKNREIVWNPKELEYSCVSAMENIILGATTMGLGACWVSLHHGLVHDILKLKDHEIVIGGIIIGHLRPDEGEQSTRHERGEIKDIFTLYE